MIGSNPRCAIYTKVTSFKEAVGFINYKALELLRNNSFKIYQDTGSGEELIDENQRDDIIDKLVNCDLVAICRSTMKYEDDGYMTDVHSRTWYDIEEGDIFNSLIFKSSNAEDLSWHFNLYSFRSVARVTSENFAPYFGSSFMVAILMMRCLKIQSLGYSYGLMVMAKKFTIRLTSVLCSFRISNHYLRRTGTVS